SAAISAAQFFVAPGSLILKTEIQGARTNEREHSQGAAHQKTRFLPREHGATAMLLTPIVCAAILAREWRWSELATLIAAIAVLAAKDPMVVLARQRFVWKQRHLETAAAMQWLAGWIVLLILCGLVFVATWPLTALIALGLGV